MVAMLSENYEANTKLHSLVFGGVLKTKTMAQKIVTFEVAKALKEAGYPQPNNDLYYNENGTVRCRSPHTFTVTYACPSYLSVWLWLWREKKLDISVNYYDGDMNCWESDAPTSSTKRNFFSPCSGPEEAIVAAIDYLVENNLIK